MAVGSWLLNLAKLAVLAITAFVILPCLVGDFLNRVLRPFRCAHPPPCRAWCALQVFCRISRRISLRRSSAGSPAGFLGVCMGSANPGRVSVELVGDFDRLLVSEKVWGCAWAVFVHGLRKCGKRSGEA